MNDVFNVLAQAYNDCNLWNPDKRMPPHIEGHACNEDLMRVSPYSPNAKYFNSIGAVLHTFGLLHTEPNPGLSKARKITHHVFDNTPLVQCLSQAAWHLQRWSVSEVELDFSESEFQTMWTMALLLAASEEYL